MIADNPPPAATSQQRFDDAKAALERALKTPHCIRRLREAAHGTTRRLADSDERINEVIAKGQAELEAEAHRIEDEAAPPTT